MMFIPNISPLCFQSTKLTIIFENLFKRVSVFNMHKDSNKAHKPSNG